MKIEPENPQSWITLAARATRLLRQEEALAAYEQAARLKPENPAAHVHRPHSQDARQTQRQRGRLQSRAGDGSGLAEAYWSLADLKNYSFSDAEVATMQQSAG